MWGQGAWVGGQRSSWTSPTETMGWHLAPWSRCLKRDMAGQTGFATLKSGSCGKSYVRVLVKTSALLCADKHRGPTARVGRGLLLFSW